MKKKYIVFSALSVIFTAYSFMWFLFGILLDITLPLLINVSGWVAFIGSPLAIIALICRMTKNTPKKTTYKASLINVIIAAVSFVLLFLYAKLLWTRIDALEISDAVLITCSTVILVTILSAVVLFVISLIKSRKEKRAAE